MTFEDLDEFFDPTLPLPIGGKTYTIPSPSADVGIRCQRMFSLMRRAAQGHTLTADEAASLRFDDEDERTWHRTLLGPIYDELVADDVPWAKIQRVSSTAFTWITQGKSAAEAVWTANRPEAPAPAPAKQPKDRQKKKARPASPAGSTPRPKKTASPGPDSSSTGS